MSLFSKLSRALGFSSSDDEEEADNMLETTDENVNTDGTAADIEDQSGDNSKEDIALVDVTLPGKIFDEVIRLFNGWQPEFVSSCLNTEAQRKFLYEAISLQVREELEKAVALADEQARVGLEEEQKRTNAKLDELRRTNERLDEKRQELKTAQLSDQRQKRALYERVHDLESQVARLESDNEQYVLENRSILNKLRLARVDASLIADMPDTDPVADEEKEQLNAEIERLQAEQSRLASEIERLSSEKEGVVAEKDSVMAENESLRSDIAALTGEIDDLKHEFESVKSDASKADERAREYEEMRNRRDLMVAQANAETNRIRNEALKREKEMAAALGEARRDTEAVLKEKESLKQEMEAMQCEIERLKSRLKEADDRFEAAKVTLADAEQRVSEAMSQKRRRGRPKKSDVRKENNDRRPETGQTVAPVSATEVPDGDLRDIDTYTEPLTAAESLPFYGDIKDLLPPGKTAAPEASAKSKRSVKPVISAIDELIDGSDWMTLSSDMPPVQKTVPKEPPAEDDFGYKAPPKRSHIDNDAQMSLW